MKQRQIVVVAFVDKKAREQQEVGTFQEIRVGKVDDQILNPTVTGTVLVTVSTARELNITHTVLGHCGYFLDYRLQKELSSIKGVPGMQPGDIAERYLNGQLDLTTKGQLAGK